MLRLTTLPIPNHPGKLITRVIDFASARQMIERASDLKSHIGFIEVHERIQTLTGKRIPLESRHIPPPANGDVFLTIRKRLPTDPIEKATWLRTEFYTGA